MILEIALAQREAEHRPIRIGLIGAGFMGRGITLQLCTPLVGMRLVAIANRHLQGAQRAWAEAGVQNIVSAQRQSEVDGALAANRPLAVEDPALLCHAQGIDVLIEVTGSIESAARSVTQAIAGRKHVVLMNAELDATLGPLLKARADEAGIVFSNADGDEPALALDLLRYVRTVGYRPVMAGNLKGFLDRYRTPDTQRGFAEKTGQDPVKCAAYADGTKLNFEACVLANATGMQVGQRGMFGPPCDHVNDLASQIVQHVKPERLLEQPLVDYVLGAQPGAGVFVVGYNDEPKKQHYMNYLKMGSGPLYVFYRPHVLPHLEAPLTAARAVLFGQASIAPQGPPACEVITVAKRDLLAGEMLDGVGGFMSYGLIENAFPAGQQDLLPMGLSAGCRLLRAVAKDDVVTYSDVELPAGRLADRLRAEQLQYFERTACSTNTSSARSGAAYSTPVSCQVPAKESRYTQPKAAPTT